MIEVTLARQIQSANAFVNRRGFGGTNAYRKDRDAWAILLRAGLRPRHKPDRLVAIHVVSYRNRVLDKANLIGGAKGLVDCLVRLGYLHDDSPKWMEATYEQIQVPRTQARTVILIDV